MGTRRWKRTKNGRKRGYVWVIGDGDVAQLREIQVQDELDDAFVIRKGLKADDKIVLEGVRQVRGAQKVEYEFRKAEEVPAKPK